MLSLVEEANESKFLSGDSGEYRVKLGFFKELNYLRN